MRITSQAFADGQLIPIQYTLYGENRIPPLQIEEVPLNAQSLALIVDDPDAPGGTFNHWLLFNIDPKTRAIDEESIPVAAMQGRNDFGRVQYDGPRPPSGEHRYFFRAYALSTLIALPTGTRRPDLDREMKNHIVDTTVLIGKYAR